MKRGIALVLAALLSIGSAAVPVWGSMSAPIYVTVDNVLVQFVGQQPLIIDGRTMVPVRGVFEELGFDVEWKEETRTVTLKDDLHTIYIVQDQPTFLMNGATFDLNDPPVPAQNVGGRVLVPLAAVLRSVGYTVGWNDGSRTVVVTSPTTSAEIAYYADYPAIPDLGSFSNPRAGIELTNSLTDESLFWYRTVPSEVIEEYAAEMLDIGWEEDRQESKDGFTVFTKDKQKVTVDAINHKADGYTVVTVSKLLEMLPGGIVPSIQGYAHWQAKEGTARNGDVYWFAQINDTAINAYTELLKAQDFKPDEYRSKTGRWVYVKGETTVIVESPTQANNGNTLITVEDSIVYFTKHPSVPVPSGSADKTAPADTGAGTTYSYVANTEINVQAYIALLVELGFNNDTTKTGNGVYVYTKNDVTVTLDTVAVSNYVQLNVKTAVQATVPTVFYQDFPDVPSLAVPFYQRNSIDVPGGYGFAYWYQVITAETMDSYTAMLKNMGYTVTGDNVGGYTCVKGDTTVKIDPVSVRVTRTNVIVQTTPPPQLTSFYARYPNAVPNFAFVLIEQYPFVEVQPTAGGTAGVWKYEHIAEGLAGDTKFEGFVKMYEARLKLEGFTLEPISGIYLNSDKEVAVSVEHIPTANSTGIKHVYIVTVSELGD